MEGKKEVWAPDQPLRDLPDNLTKLFSGHADFLYKDLEFKHLDVVLIPAPEQKFEGHMIRYVENRNPSWYRELYREMPNFRRDRSLVSLDRLRREEDNSYVYDFIYRKLILEHLTEGYEDEIGSLVGPSEEVQLYFNHSFSPSAKNHSLDLSYL